MVKSSRSQRTGGRAEEPHPGKLNGPEPRHAEGVNRRRSGGTNPPRQPPLVLSNVSADLPVTERERDLVLGVLHAEIARLFME